MAVEIPLTQGFVTLVDDEDAEAVLSLRCHAHRERNLVYAITSVNGRKVRLHRWLLDAPAAMQVDHISRDTLDNRRSNLRLATHSQNLFNIPPRNRLKGITRVGAKWKAQIGFQGKHLHLGYFHTDAEAAREYDRVAADLFGEFAFLNFPQEV